MPIERPRNYHSLSWEHQREFDRLAEAVQYQEWQAERDIEDAKNHARHVERKAKQSMEEYRNIQDELEGEVNELGERLKALKAALTTLVEDGECYCADRSPCGWCVAKAALNLDTK